MWCLIRRYPDCGAVVTSDFNTHDKHGLRPHLYADDTQIFGSCRPLHSSRAACLRVLMTSGYGCGPTGCSSTWRRRMNHWGWARTLFSPSSLFEISTQTCQWTRSSRELFPVVLLFCDKYAASVDPSVNPSCSRSSCHWSFHGWKHFTKLLYLL